jgi:hypothetical protein
VSCMLDTFYSRECKWLSRLESSVCEKMRVSSFEELGHGSMIHLICNRPVLQHDFGMLEGDITRSDVVHLILETMMRHGSEMFCLFPSSVKLFY